MSHAIDTDNTAVMNTEDNHADIKPDNNGDAASAPVDNGAFDPTLKPKKKKKKAVDLGEDGNGEKDDADTPVGGLDMTLKKKKKKPVDLEDEDASGEKNGAETGADGLDTTLKKKKPADADGEDTPGNMAGAEKPVEGLDTTLKKKKKKKAPKDDEVTKKLEALDLEDTAAQEEEVPEGNIEDATGIWAHDEQRCIPYVAQLARLFAVMAEKNPEHAQSGSKSYKIPPPQCLREGNRKTIFANIADICKRMKRTEEHVTSYLFAELGTNGSTDGTRRLVIKGRFQQKQIENVLRKYIIEYVTCKTCKSANTELSKGENRLYFLTCSSCGSRRSVNAIKTGFSAQIGKRKKMA